MTRTDLYPLLFEPVLKDYLWGGRNLATRLGRTLPDGTVAESWEIAAHPDGTTQVANGPLAGTPLTDLQEAYGLDLIGRHNRWAQERGKFPLLIKLLDANDKLSVQVHPDDAYALAHEGNELGKTEMWVVLHAEPGASIDLGVRPGTTPEALAAAIEDGTVESLVHELPIHTGDTVCVPSGSLHALLGGSLIAEIQQNSNTTYRVYDWGRTRDGQPRPLHVRQALDVINFEQIEPALPKPRLLADTDGIRREELCRNRYFVTERVTMGPGAKVDGMCDGRTLEIWGAIEGQVEVNDVALEAVRFALLPAAMGAYEVRTSAGATLLRTYVPPPPTQ
jgi:mannose-6-phosphate isomerase